MMKCEQCSTPLGTPSKCPETKRRVKKEPGPDSAVSWVVAFAAFLINFIMAGLSRMSGILYVEFIEMFNIDRKGASMPFSVRSSTMNLLGPVVGILGQKYGVRKVSVIGGVLGVISAAGCFFADDITWITVIWGGLNGAGTALVTTLTTVVIAQYFDKYKTTASGLSFSGACVGSFVFPPLIEYLLDAYGLGGSFLIVAGIIMHVLPAAMILHKPDWVKKADRAAESERKRRVESSCSLDRSVATDEHKTDAVDLNYLRSNGELIVKLFTADASSRGSDEKGVVYPPKDDILREMEDMYALVGKTPISSRLSEVPPEMDMKKTCDIPLGDTNEKFQTPNRLSVGDYRHTPVRKVKSALGSLQTPKCKPFIVHKLKELYSKADHQIMSSFGEKKLYGRVLKELRMLHKVYEAVIKRNIFSKSRPFVSKPAKTAVPKMAPKTLIPGPQKAPGQTGVWESVKNSMKLHTKPLFLLISLCRAVHFSTFIPAVTIIVDYAMDKGMQEEDGKYVIAAMSVGDLLGRLCFGWVTDKGFISLARYMLLVMVLQGMCTASLPMMTTMTTLLPAICVYALLQGSVFVRHSVLISKYMRRDEQAIAMGCVNFFAGLLGFAVPSYVGFFRDTMGSYDTIFYLNGAAGALTGLLWVFEPCFVKLSSDLPKFSEVEKV